MDGSHKEHGVSDSSAAVSSAISKRLVTLRRLCTSYASLVKATIPIHAGIFTPSIKAADADITLSNLVLSY